MSRYVCGAASAVVTSDSGVTVARVSGVVTAASAGDLIARISARARLGGALANVVFYDSALMAVTHDRLLAASRVSSGSTPTAIVASADQMPMFTSYAAAAMGAGILKAAFATEAEARRWASQQAEVRAYWLSLRRALRSEP